MPMRLLPSPAPAPLRATALPSHGARVAGREGDASDIVDVAQ
jgi:hypothetical protein